MYAIVEIAGQQFKVAKDQKVFVHRLANDEGDSVSFDNVLLIGDGDNITVGAPAISGAQVGATVVRHLKGDKVIVFKKKRRKGYRVKNGHRQALSEIMIGSILTSGATPAKKEEKKAGPKPVAKKAAPKKDAKEVAKPKAKKETSSKEAKVETKKAAVKKSEVKADDLTKIEGAGPKAAEAMVNAGYDTFAKVAKESAEKLSEVLSEASSNLSHIVTDTWPKQAKLAAEGKWDELKELQDRLDGGIEK